MASVTLNYNSSTLTVYCQTVTAGWNNNTTAKPKVNGGAVVEAQTHSFENPIYNLQGVQLTEDSGTLTYSALLEMAKNRYDGTNGITLEIDYGIDSSTYLVGSDGTTTAIPVIIKSFNATIPVQDIYGSTRKHLPTLTINLQETA